MTQPPNLAQALESHPVLAQTLEVPGAQLYYETRGHGPTLLIIPGGPQDAGTFTALAEELADTYTVITYDPRGNSRSPFVGEPEDLQVDVQSDDAAALIATLGDAPAYVFGTSGGAQIGLDLAARHPERVRVLVAHESPCAMLLADPSQILDVDQDLYDTYRRDGIEAAMGKFFAANGLDDMAAEAPSGADAMSPEEAETFARVGGNFEYWLAHGMLPLTRYRPAVEVLREGEPHVVVAVGDQSLGQPIHTMVTALAEKLGAQPVLFPGDHFGFESHRSAFAEVLRQSLEDAASRK